MIFFSDFGASAALTPPQVALFLNRITSTSTTQNITWNSETADPYGCITAPSTDILIPASLNGALLRVSGNLQSTRDDQRMLPLLGGAAAKGLGGHTAYTGTIFGTEYCNFASAPLTYATGNTLTVINQYGSGFTSGDAVNGNPTWLQLEKLDANTRRIFLEKTSDQGPATGARDVTWSSTPIVNVGGFTTDGTSITIPSGVSAIRVCAGVQSDAAAGTRSELNLEILHNGARAYGIPCQSVYTMGDHRASLMSAIIPVSAGDTVLVQVNTAASVSIRSGATAYFSVEEVPSTIQRCLAIKNASQTFTSYTPAAVTWGGTDIYDTASIHNPSSNNSRFYCPPGCTKGRLITSLAVGTVAGKGFEMSGRKNGSNYLGQPLMSAGTTGSGTISMGAVGAWVDMDNGAGDYFEMWAQCGNVNLNLGSDSTFKRTWCMAEFI